MSMPTLVAIKTFFRLPVFFIQLPRMVSDSPPLFPGFQVEYMSAVSMKLKPAATKASSTINEAGSSMVQPKTFPPSAKGASSNPEFPNFRFFMFGFPFLLEGLHFYPLGWMLRQTLRG